MNLANIDIGSAVSGLGALAKNIREAITGEAILDQNKKAEIIAKTQELEASLDKTRMSIAVAEAQSTNPIASNSRPAFLWVFYFIIIVLVIVAPFVGIFYPEGMKQFYINVAAGFNAIPGAMWATFSAGYLGYAGLRQYGKTKGTDK